MSAAVNFSWGNLPDGFCFSTLESYKNDIFNLLEGTVDVTGIVIGPNTPSVSDQDKLWQKTDAAGRPERLYLFLGSWISLNPRSPSSPERIIWAGAETDLWAYDGGDGTDPGTTPPTLTTGAMWQVDHTFDFLIPMGAGTSPVIYDGGSATVLTQGATLGAERVALSDTEIAHRHINGRFASNAVSEGFFLFDNAVTTITGDGERIPGGGGGTPGSKITNDVGAQAGDWMVTSEVQLGTTTRTSHQNLPPVMGVFFGKRTARKFYSA